jgi:Uma2 family endonuclease
MAQVAERPATYEGLLAVPEHLVAEVLFGRLAAHPRPAPLHAGAASVLGGILTPPCQLGRGGPGGWIILDEPELHSGKHVTVPDLAGWRRQRLIGLPDTSWIEVPPDWTCEVLSPSTEGFDRGEKRTIYADVGVAHLWHVDPRPKILETLELRDGKWLLLDVLRDKAEVAAPPIAEVSFPLGLLSPFDAPQTAST